MVLYMSIILSCVIHKTTYNSPFPSLTQKWDSIQHGTDLLHRTLGLAAFMAVAAKTVDPPQQPASVCFGLFVKFLQQLGGD